MASVNQIIEAIDTAPLNRGLKGADWLARPGNVPVTFDTGDVVLFDHEGDGAYQVHVLFKSRGREAIEHIHEAFRRMFVEHDCTLIFGMVPDFRRDVKLLARWTGMRSAGERWASEGPGLANVKFELFILSKAQWKVAQR
jgi:hypothetical protein